MNILKPDSPVMDFLRTVTNLVIVNILYIICSIPIITFGAAYSAKYYVAMKVIRGEGTGVVIPFFKAFKRNFKQATAVWIVMLVAIFLIIFDWRWITYNGWSNTEFVYKFFVIFFSFAVLLMTMAIFPTIARYDMKTSELFKAALISHACGMHSGSLWYMSSHRQRSRTSFRSYLSSSSINSKRRRQKSSRP